VENAIKHGITKKPGGGTVRISTYATDDAYVIEVTDDGVGFDVDFKHDDGKTHVGIDNVRARLKDMCRGTLTIKSMANVGTRVTIEIPKKKGK
jgi:sensor histidine kinase YesM